MTAAGAPASAQDPPATATRNPVWGFVTDVGNDFLHLPSKNTAITLVTGGSAALSAQFADEDVREYFARHEDINPIFKPGRITGYGHVQLAIAAGTMLVGHFSQKPRVTHTGSDLLRGQIVTQAVTYGLKYASRRERPDGSDHHSFPSGHASVTFTTATVLQRHLGWRLGIPTYAVAVYVASSRLHEDRHHLSDVLFGATVGVMSGLTVTRHGRSHWGLTPVIAPGVTAVQVRYER